MNEVFDMGQHNPEQALDLIQNQLVKPAMTQAKFYPRDPVIIDNDIHFFGAFKVHTLDGETPQFGRVLGGLVRRDYSVAFLQNDDDVIRRVDLDTLADESAKNNDLTGLAVAIEDGRVEMGLSTIKYLREVHHTEAMQLGEILDVATDMAVEMDLEQLLATGNDNARFHHGFGPDKTIKMNFSVPGKRFLVARKVPGDAEKAPDATAWHLYYVQPDSAADSQDSDAWVGVQDGPDVRMVISDKPETSIVRMKLRRDTDLSVMTEDLLTDSTLRPFDPRIAD